MSASLLPSASRVLPGCVSQSASLLPTLLEGEAGCTGALQTTARDRRLSSARRLPERRQHRKPDDREKPTSMGSVTPRLSGVLSALPVVPRGRRTIAGDRLAPSIGQLTVTYATSALAPQPHEQRLASHMQPVPSPHPGAAERRQLLQPGFADFAPWASGHGGSVAPASRSTLPCGALSDASTTHEPSGAANALSVAGGGPG